MRLNGEWFACSDGDIRPIVRASLLCGNGVWLPFEMLVDTGADRTVLSASVFDESKLPGLTPDQAVGGIGGAIPTVVVSSQLRIARADGQYAFFRSQYAACVDLDSLDMSVLGRDILDMFALIVDRRANIVAIIGQDHTYTIHSHR
jgi:predicted aspartyl protease